jgi:transcriptional regulator with XRE-family HTH domain
VHTEGEKDCGKKDNDGARALRSRFPDRGGISEVAEKVGTDSSVVSRWFSGERKPDPKMRARLQDEYGIDWRLFDNEDEKGAA